MIDIDIINGTIAEWEAKDLTFFTVERLAWLYIVRDHLLMNKTTEDEEKVQILPSIAISSGSEFMNVCSETNVSHLWEVLDELMTTLQVIQPKLYESTIRMLRNP